MSFRSPITGPITVSAITGAVTVDSITNPVTAQTANTPGLVVGQPQPLNLNGSSAVSFISAVGGGTITVVTLTPPAGKTAFLLGFDWNVQMKASPLNQPKVAITGPAAALSYTYPSIVSSGQGNGGQSYAQPIPASAPDTPIVLTFSYTAGNAGITGNAAALNAYAYSL